MSNHPSSRLCRHVMIGALALVSMVAGRVAAYSDAAAPGAIVSRARPASQAVSTAPRNALISPQDAELLKAQLEATRARVVALAAQVEVTLPGAERDALQAEIVRIKSEGEISFLQLQVDLARRAGDQPRVALAEQALQNLLNPPALPASAPQETKGLPAAQEGGRP